MTGTYTFTDQQKADIRRFMGYPAFGGANAVGFEDWRFFQVYGLMEFRMNNLSEEEGGIVVTTYLTNLYTLENAIPATLSNIPIDQAAVFKHNMNEVRDTQRLFDNWRYRLCMFLGIPAGPGLNTGNSVKCIV